MEANLKIHLVLSSIISFCLWLILVFVRNRIDEKAKLKALINFLITFVGFYFLLMLAICAYDYKCQLDVQGFDLDNSGFIDGDEITSESSFAVFKASSDLARVLAPITGVIYAFFLTGLTYLSKIPISKILRRIKK